MALEPFSSCRRLLPCLVASSYYLSLLSSATVIHSIETLQVETYCTVIICGKEGRLILAPFIVAGCQSHSRLHGDYLVWHLQEYFFFFSKRGSDFQAWHHAHAWEKPANVFEGTVT